MTNSEGTTSTALANHQTWRHRDYYRVLGVRGDATMKDLEHAYWAEAFDPKRRDDLALINEAYETLGHQETRDAYDGSRRGVDASEAGPGRDTPSEGTPRRSAFPWPLPRI